MNLPSDPSPWSGPRRRPGRWILAGLLLAGAGLLFLPPVKRKILTVIDRLRTERVITKTETVEKIVEKQVEEAAPPAPLPNGPSLGTKKDVAAIFGGITLESNLITGEGRRATLERNDAASYAVEFNFKIKVPVPARTLEDFMGINPEIPVLIPGFKDLLTSAKVSGFFHYQYQQKQNFLQANILRLDRVLSRHNFYDLESVLELENAATKQKALLLQGEMDVVSDGSDGDRMDSFDDYIFKSQHFQPTTSYAWEKTCLLYTSPSPRD